MREDSMLADVKRLQAAVDRLSALETPAPGKGLWADRPTIPVQDQQYFATDATRKIQYFWDVTSANWLSTQLFTSPYTMRSGSVVAAAAGDFFAQAVQMFDVNLYGYNRGGGVYLVDSLRTIFLNSAQSAASHYDTSATVQPGGTPAITAGTFSPTTAITNGAWRPMPDTLGIVVPATSNLLQVTMSPAGGTATPGTFFMTGTIGYRLVG